MIRANCINQKQFPYKTLQRGQTERPSKGKKVTTRVPFWLNLIIALNPSPAVNPKLSDVLNTTNAESIKASGSSATNWCAAIWVRPRDSV